MGLSRQSQTLVVGLRRRVSHSSPRRWLLLGNVVVLMAVSHTGCGLGRGMGSHGSSQTLFVGGGEAGVLMAVPYAGSGG